MSAEITPVRHQSKLSRRVTPPVAPPIDTTAILEALRAKAGAVLGAAEGANLSAFQVGALGNFPYVWQNPSNLEFNHVTYEWINSNLAANTTPAALDDALFTAGYKAAISAVTYQLSNADTEKLNAAQALAVTQQAALLNAWVAAYGSLPQPSPGQQPIDAVVSTIATTWASPATTLAAMGDAADLAQTLNNTPASGVPILPVLAEWLGVMDSVIPLQNAQTMNNAYLAKVRAALTSPLATNSGALVTDDGILHPAYAFAASSSVSDIENGLSGTSTVKMGMSVVRSSASEFTVSLAGQTSFSIPVDDFITVNVSASASYFKDTIATSENTVSVNMDFSGVTLVNFGPLPFDPSTLQNWYWMAPITEAIANGSFDVSGFRFATDPGIDFSTSGPFGYLKGVAIANYPTVTIVVTSSEYEKINTVFQSQVSVDVSFIGISLASGSASSYSNMTSVDHASQTVTITLNPPPALIAGKATDSTAWILGVQTEYPAATN